MVYLFIWVTVRHFIKIFNELNYFNKNIIILINLTKKCHYIPSAKPLVYRSFLSHISSFRL